MQALARYVTEWGISIVRVWPIIYLLQYANRLWYRWSDHDEAKGRWKPQNDIPLSMYLEDWEEWVIIFTVMRKRLKHMPSLFWIIQYIKLWLTSRDVPKSRQLVLPYSLNIHIHPVGIVNPKNHCYLNSVIQLLLPILRTISFDFQFNSSTEGTLSKYMLETAYNAYSSTDVDVLKFQLVQYNQFYDGKNQQDSSECLLMLIEIINKGSVPYYGSHVSNSTGVSLSDILFSFMLEKYIVCNVCGLRSPSIESSGVLYISPTHTSSMQELIMQGLQQKLEKSCFRCNKNTWHVESNHILQPPNYLIIVVNRFRYINNQFAKDKCSIPMDMTVVLGYHKFSLQATIDHHGPSIYSGHYTTSVNCCNRTFYCNDNKITEFDMINTKNSSTAYVVIYKLIT